MRPNSAIYTPKRDEEHPRNRKIPLPPCVWTCGYIVRTQENILPVNKCDKRDTRHLFLSGPVCYFTLLATLVQKVDSTIHWTDVYALGNAIGLPNTYRWIVIYPVDSAIQRLSNRDLFFVQCRVRWDSSYECWRVTQFTHLLDMVPDHMACYPREVPHKIYLRDSEGDYHIAGFWY